MAVNLLTEEAFDEILASLEALKTQVENWEALAQKWAENPEDVEVATGQYSALHHALKAASHKIAAETAKTDAETALASVQQIFDDFDDRYLGSKTSDPATDNDGDALSPGLIYWNSTAEELRFYNGATWEAPSAQAATSATNALASENKAADWAEEDEDVEVETGQYSAKHHALKALASMQAAGTSASNAAASEQKAADWAEEDEDVEVETGQYSAKHWAKKSEAEATLSIQGIDFDAQVDDQVDLPSPPPEGDLAKYYIINSQEIAVYRSSTSSWNIASLGSVTVEDNLTSSSTSAALSANQGKHLEDNKLEVSLKGNPNGLAELDGNGKVPPGQLKKLDVRDYGAQATAGFNSTSAFQAMADDVGYIAIPYTVLPFEIDNITTTKQTVVYAKHGYAHVKARTPAILNDPVFVLNHARSGIGRGVHIDGNSTSRSCVSIPADNCFAYFTAENVTADADSTTYTSGLEVTGNNCRFEVYAENFSNTGQVNGSVPRVVTVQGTADNYSGRVQGKDVCSGLLIGDNTGRGKVSENIIEDATDNGLYQLGGDLEIGEQSYKGNEEGIVVAGNLQIGMYTIHGGGITGIGLNSVSGNLRIGTLHLQKVGSESIGNIMKTRSGSGFGEVHIDRITGRMRGNVMFNLGNELAVKNLSIGSVDVDYEYDAGVSGLPSQWCNFEDVERFSIKNFKCRIIDINDVLTNEEFRFRLPTVTKKSEIHHPRIEILDSDESTKSSATLAISSHIQDDVSYIPSRNPGIFEARGITIGDDSVKSITGLSSRCIVFAILVKASADTGFFSFQLAASLPTANLISQATTLFEVSTGVPTGTTGTDGKITFFADTSESGKLTIENRQGSSRTLQLFIIEE